MSSFNKVILMGNFTRDPELRQTQSGTSVCRFSIAVNRSYNSQDGSTRDETCFVEVDSFGYEFRRFAACRGGAYYCDFTLHMCFPKIR